MKEFKEQIQEKLIKWVAEDINTRSVIYIVSDKNDKIDENGKVGSVTNLIGGNTIHMITDLADTMLNNPVLEDTVRKSLMVLERYKGYLKISGNQN